MGSLAGDPDRHHRGILPAADAFQHPQGRFGPDHTLGVGAESLPKERLGGVGDGELLHGVPLSDPAGRSLALSTYLLYIYQVMLSSIYQLI